MYFVFLPAAVRVSALTTPSHCQCKKVLAGTVCRMTNEAEHLLMCLSATPVPSLVRCPNALYQMCGPFHVRYVVVYPKDFFLSLIQGT